MKKAKYIGKYYGTGCERGIIYLEYEYRGRKYTVEDNRNKGSIPIAWQHKNEQISIDAAIEREERRQADIESGKFIPKDSSEAVDMFLDYLDGKISEEEFLSYCES